MLHKYGLENPESGLADKVRGYHFSEKIKVHDPYTMRKDMKHLKPFMVNNSVRVFENRKIMLQHDDKDFIEQLGAYRVKSISQSGLPVYSDENEHAIDALNLCLLAFEQNYGELFKQVLSHSVHAINGITMNDVNNIKTRSINKEESKIQVLEIGNNTVHVYSNNSKRKNLFTRRTF